jgi:cytochrome P450
MGELPPGPPGRLPTLLRYMRNPYTLFRTARDRYGDPFTIKTIGRTVVTGRPEGVRQIFSAPLEQYRAELSSSQRRVLGEEGLSTFSGEAHKRERQLLAPCFRGERLRRLGEMMQHATRQHAAAWQPGRPLVMRDAAMEIALDIILRAIFGVEPGRDLEKAKRVVRAFVDAFGNPGFLAASLLQLEFDRAGPLARFRRARRDLEALIEEVIAARRLQPSDRPDLLNQMMRARYDDGGQMSDRKLIDNLVTNLVAGHETSAMTITWALYWLLSHDGARERVIDEIAALGAEPDPETVVGLPFLDAVVRETLRLWPLVPDVVRVVAQPFDLLGHLVPPGIKVAAASALTHYDPAIYPEPESFRPERFLDRRISPFEFFPFGGGGRICIGAHFAVYEVKIILATLLQGRRLDLVERAPPAVRRKGFLMGPASGVPVTIRAG